MSKETSQIPPEAARMTAEGFLYSGEASPHIHRYLALTRMAQDDKRPQERRELLKKTALDMLSNTTNIEGVSFMPPPEHTVFMADLVTHGKLSLEEVQKGV